MITSPFSTVKRPIFRGATGRSLEAPGRGATLGGGGGGQGEGEQDDQGSARRFLDPNRPYINVGPPVDS